MNAYPARLVLQSVSDVTPKEIDYSKADAMTKGDAATFAGQQCDIVRSDCGRAEDRRRPGRHAGGRQARRSWRSSASGEHTGVTCVYGSANEAAAKDEAPGAKDSPDGILYNCTFNQDRLQGDADAQGHYPHGPAHLRPAHPDAGNEERPAFVLEYNAWVHDRGGADRHGQSS